MRFRHAATLCLVRSGAGGIEVLLGQRGSAARFVAGAHVFPGGVVDEVDGSSEAMHLTGGVRDPWKMAAIRETYEEVGILVGTSEPGRALGHDGAFYRDLVATGATVDLDALTYLSTWITPPGFPYRYDTRFYLATVSKEPVIDGVEFVDAVWAQPGTALQRMDDGEWNLVSPTIAHLDFLAQFVDVESLLEGVGAGRDLERIDQSLVEGHRPDGLEIAP